MALLVQFEFRNGRAGEVRLSEAAFCSATWSAGLANAYRSGLPDLHGQLRCLLAGVKGMTIRANFSADLRNG